jgi:outer membrane protein insertion porin family
MMTWFQNRIVILLFSMACLGQGDGDYSGYTIDELIIEGNRHFSVERIKQLMVSRPGWLWLKRTFQPALFEQDLHNIQQFYHQQGFLEMRVLSHQAEGDESTRRLSILLTLEEGERTTIEGINLFGNQQFPDSILKSVIKVNPGRPLMAKEIDETQTALLHFYAEAGFIDAEVTVNVKTAEQSHRAVVDFHILENRVSLLNRVFCEGLIKTRPSVVLREMQVDSAEVIQYSKLLETQKRLYLTGLFDYVFVKPGPIRPDNPLMRDIRIEVQEHPYGEFNISTGYGSEDKIRTRIEIAQKNVRGTARNIGLHTWLSFIQRGVMVSATDPWLFNQPVNADLNFLMEFKDEPGYNLYRSGGQGILGKRLGQFVKIRLALRQDFTRFSQVKTMPDDQGRANIRSIKWAITYDARDNLFDTKRGIFFEFSYELARAVFEKHLIFHRYEGEYKIFRPFRSAVLGTGISFGWMNTSAAVTDIPLNERYYVGGQGSVRGFDYKKIGPLNSKGIPTGGLIKIIWRVGELRHPLVRSLSGAIFCDAGNCWEKELPADRLHLRSSAGLGLRFHFFLGVVRMDYAWKLDRRPGEKAGALVFNMGHAF